MSMESRSESQNSSSYHVPWRWNTEQWMQGEWNLGWRGQGTPTALWSQLTLAMSFIWGDNVLVFSCPFPSFAAKPFKTTLFSFVFKNHCIFFCNYSPPHKVVALLIVQKFLWIFLKREAASTRLSPRQSSSSVWWQFSLYSLSLVNPSL